MKQAFTVKGKVQKYSGKEGVLVLAVKKEVRKKEGMDEGFIVTVDIEPARF